MDLELFDTGDDAPKNVRAGTRFQPKAKLHPPKKATPAVVPFSRQVSTIEQSEVVIDSPVVVPCSQQVLTIEQSEVVNDSPVVVPSSQQVPTIEQSEVVNDSPVVVPSSRQVSTIEQSEVVNESPVVIPSSRQVSTIEQSEVVNESPVVAPSSQQVSTIEQSEVVNDSPVVVPSSQQVSTIEQSEVVNDDSSEGGANSMVDSGAEKNEDLKDSFERSTEENIDIMIELESLTGILDTPPVSNVLDDPVIIIQPDVVDDLSCFSHILDVSIADDPLTENEFMVVEPVLNRDEHVHQTTGPGKLASRRRAKNTKNDQSSNLHEEGGIANSRVLRKRQNRENSFRLVDELDDDYDDVRGRVDNDDDAHARVDNDDSEIQPNKSPGEKEKPKRKRKKDYDDARAHARVDNDDDDARVHVDNDDDARARVDNEDSIIQPNKSPGEKEKPKRKRNNKKKTDETTKEEEPPKKKKKFPRATKRRKVDKSLLENPDNIDHRNISLTNLIRLAEYKERAAKKIESQAPPPPPPDQTTINNSRFQEYNNDDDDDDNIAFDEPGYFDGEPIMAEENSGFYNYHTFMNKTSRSKWTDQDTELFYEGIQQFGTDFTMIQQLFPGRTRRQVKLKYKKEESKHPIRVREAIMNRAKGHSHFDTVIERLKQIAAEEKKNNKNDDDNDNDDNNDNDSVNVEYEEVDEPEIEPEPKNKDEKEEDGSARIDHEEDVVNKVVEDEANVTEQAYDSEDELFQWSQYKSDF